MSTPEPPAHQPVPPAQGTASTPGTPPAPGIGSGPVSALRNTPNAERYVLEADAMRRRQLRSALLHGSRRTWREHQRLWPAVVVGILAAAFIVAGIIVYNAVQVTEDNTPSPQQSTPTQSASPTARTSPRGGG